jgi:endonuclease G
MHVIKKFGFLTVAACLAWVGSAHASEPLANCAEYSEYGIPSDDGTLVCRKGLLLAHDEQFLTPIWVIHHFSKEKEALELAKRSSNFRADTALPKGKRAEDSDYTNSGFDRGHMAPAADMKWHEEAMYNSFFLSNAVPQNKDNNQKIWADLELLARKWAVLRGDILIFSGPIYENDKASMTIGKNKVGVPDMLFKVVFDTKRKEAIAFLIPNQAIDRKTLENYIVSVREIESITGLNFFSNLPRKEQNKIEKVKAVMWESK